jgi:hypothetical protein
LPDGLKLVPNLGIGVQIGLYLSADLIPGSAVAVAAAPKSIAPASVPVAIAPVIARRAGRAEDNMAGSFIG